MNTSDTQQASLEQKMQMIREQLLQGSTVFEDFRQVYDDLRRTQREFQDLLQWAVEDRRWGEQEKEFQELTRRAAGWNASDLMETLKRTGFALKKEHEVDKENHLKEAFDRQGYRLLELVRAGKRDEVFHALLRIFVSAKKEFPSQLIEAFKPLYNGELFKVFLFSFLSGILGKEEETE